MKKQTIILLLSTVLLVAYKRADISWFKADLKEVAKELKEMQLSYSKITTYSVKINYLTYDTKNSDVVQDKSQGYFIKSGANYKSSLLGIFSVQNEKFRLTIDSSGKTMQLSNAFEFKDPGLSLNDYIKILEVCKSVKKAKQANTVAYRFETKNTEGVTAQEIYTENGITKEVNVYYTNEHFLREKNNIKKELVYPRLQVLFFDFNQKLKGSQLDFSLSPYVTINGKEIKTTERYKAYKLIDGRVKK